MFAKLLFCFLNGDFPLRRLSFILNECVLFLLRRTAHFVDRRRSIPVILSPAGRGHPELVLHGGNRRLLPRHHRRRHHRGGHGGHLCGPHRVLRAGQSELRLFTIVSIRACLFSPCRPQARYDFTMWSGVLLVLLADVIIFGFFCTFYYSHVGEVAYGCLGALLYSLVRVGHKERKDVICLIIYSRAHVKGARCHRCAIRLLVSQFLMVDCQLMMGTMSYRLDPEEYISAALTIYLDVMLIFLYLLGRR